MNWPTDSFKPTESQLHNRHFGTKGSFVHSREEAARIVEQASGAGVTFMLQEWIPGNMSKTVLLDGFVDRDGRVSMMARRRVRMNPPKLGNTVTAVTIPLEDVREATTALRLLLAEVKYRGIFNVEFKFDERDGHFKIIEVNPRPAWFIATIAKAGMDLPWMSYLDAQDLPVPESAGYRVGRYGVYELQDAVVLSTGVGLTPPSRGAGSQAVADG